MLVRHVLGEPCEEFALFYEVLEGEELTINKLAMCEHIIF